MASEFVITVENENKTGNYRLYSDWTDGGIKIEVASRNAAWNGWVSKDKIEEMANTRKVSLEDYKKECVQSLTDYNSNSGIIFAVENNSFVWKRVVDEDTGVKVRLGQIPLQPADFTETIQKMMTVALNKNIILEQQVKQLNCERAHAEGNNNQLINQLQECQEVKQKMEDDLYAQFVAILNAKKKKISSLEQELVILKTNLERSHLPRKKQRTKKTNKEKSKESCDAYDEETDEDICEPSSSTVKVSELVVDSNVANEELIDSDATISDEDLVNLNKVENMPSTFLPKLYDADSSSTMKANEVDISDRSSINITQSPSKSPQKLPKTNEDLLDFFFGGND